MIDSTAARDIVQECVRLNERPPGSGFYDDVGIVACVLKRVQAHVAVTAQPIGNWNEVYLPAMGMALTAWGFFILQAKSIEHGGQPHPTYRDILMKGIIDILDAMFVEARNLGREQKQAEKDQGSPRMANITIPRPFTDWHEDPWRP